MKAVGEKIGARLGQAQRRKRHGVYQYRMGCSRCQLVRWLPITAVGMPHCQPGSSFLFLLGTIEFDKRK